jgi:hypothetical protein
MSGSLHPTEIHRRRHRKEKRNKLRAQLAAAPAIGRAAIEAKLQKTYPLGSGTSTAKVKAPLPAAVPVVASQP